METKNRYSTIDFFEQGLRVKNLTNPTEQEKAYKIRHKIFVDELRWVSPQTGCLEIDVYDRKGMMPLGIFDQTGRLIAHLRITLPQQIFMMEGEFSTLIETAILKADDSVEVSRVCTEKNTRLMRIKTAYGNYHISMLLYKGLYRWCCHNRINVMYMVIEYKLFRLLRMSGFPCRKIGKTIIMSDGVSAVAVKLDWREFKSITKKNKPQMLAWFSDISVTRRAA